MTTTNSMALSVFILFLTISGLASSNTAIQWRQYDGSPLIDQVLDESAPYQLVDEINLTGGEYWLLFDWVKPNNTSYIVDFKNTSTIDFAEVWFLQNDHVVAHELSGASNPAGLIPLRHAVPAPLAEGNYLVVVKMSSPYFIAFPELLIEKEERYRQSVKQANAYVYFGLGIFFALMVYYGFISLQSRQFSSLFYALFILGNILYNANALQVFPQLFSIDLFWLSSFPILLSNIAYIAFVISLLDLKKNIPAMYRLGQFVMILLASFFVVSLVVPNWSMEFARIGVALFSLYGLSSGILMFRQGSKTAAQYLIANLCFIVPAALAISLSSLSANSAFFIEHIGLFAVNVECILLAMVIAGQYHRLETERQSMLSRVEEALKIAHSDPLTGLKNRLAFQNDLIDLPRDVRLAVIDLDDLKYCNDNYGHAEGDRLITIFGRTLFSQLKKGARLYRIGGDEFVILSRHCTKGEILGWVESSKTKCCSEGFKTAGASTGIAEYSEVTNTQELFELADKRMFHSKHQKKGLDLNLSEVI